MTKQESRIVVDIKLLTDIRAFLQGLTESTKSDYKSVEVYRPILSAYYIDDMKERVDSAWVYPGIMATGAAVCHCSVSSAFSEASPKPAALLTVRPSAATKNKALHGFAGNSFVARAYARTFGLSRTQPRSGEVV